MKYLFKCIICGEEHVEDLLGNVRNAILFHHPRKCRIEDGRSYVEEFGTFKLERALHNGC